MEGVDRLNELKDEMLVNNIMSRLDCTTKEVIVTTATISKRWKNLWTLLPHLIFSDIHDLTKMVVKETNLHDYISFIDNTLNKCPTNLSLKKFKLDINYSSLVNSEFKSRANSWIRYAIRRNVEEVDLWLFDVGESWMLNRLRHFLSQLLVKAVLESITLAHLNSHNKDLELVANAEALNKYNQVYHSAWRELCEGMTTAGSFDEVSLKCTRPTYSQFSVNGL
ncbi:hypothetical protein Tco_0805288 [Tanacetum coccineum]